MLISYLSQTILRQKRLFDGVLGIVVMVILLSGTLLGSVPLAHADDDDDDDDDDKKDKDKKCPKKKRYNGDCDKTKPKVKITDPDKKEKVTSSMLMVTIDATDDISGIKKVEVRINGGPLILVTTKLDSDTWKYSASCVDGTTKKIQVTAKATDNVGNVKRDHVNFRLMCVV